MNKRRLMIEIGIFLFIVSAIVWGVRSCAGNNAKNELPSATTVPGPQIQTVTVTAVGDCTFATDINAYQEKSFVDTAEEMGLDYFMQNVKSIFAEDNLTIVNFEGTLSDGGERMDKQFAFRGKPEYASILSSSSIEAANLANNHSYDYGEESFTDTEKYLDEAGIIHFGGTHTELCQANGIIIGLAGINALNDVGVSQLDGVIAELKNNGAQLVIVSIHWGIEKDTEPSEEQIELAHKAVDLGANLVIGTHPHVLQGLEKYNGGYIAYSLGNFCFGGNDHPADMDTAIYRQTFTFIDGILQEDDNIEIIPCSVSSDEDVNNYCPTPLKGEGYARVQEKLNSYTAALGPLQFKYRPE